MSKQDDKPKPQELADVDYTPPKNGWMREPVRFKKGTWNHPSTLKSLESIGMPYPRKWKPTDEDWQLPENWKQIILDGLRERLEKHRSLKIFMDTCVRCGACADKCHYYIGSGDPKNMPVLRAELLRSVYRGEFTTAGKILGEFAGARKLTPEVLKEWFYYFFQCSECRRCSVFCPYGIDTAEITMIARELLALVGIGIDWVTTPAMNSMRTGNHLGVLPHGLRDAVEFAADDLFDNTGIRPNVPIGRKGAEILFVAPSADYFGHPHYFTFLGYLALFHEIGLDYTISAFASEGGNFGLFHSFDLAKKMNAKIYEEAKRLKVKWILGGECGHMWRVAHQYMDTMNGPADFLEVPTSPITKTKFENAKSTKMVHICEFTADLVLNDAIKLDPSRNDHIAVTFHDSCNPARAMGMIEEPRICIRASCNRFYEMPEDTIRERTLCCGSGAGLGTDENYEMRMRGGYPRAMAVKQVRMQHGVDRLACICAIDKASLPAVMDFWVPGVEVIGVHELIGNALVMKGENERITDLRNSPNGKAPENSGEKKDV